MGGGGREGRCRDGPARHVPVRVVRAELALVDACRKSGGGVSLVRLRRGERWSAPERLAAPPAAAQPPARGGEATCGDRPPRQSSTLAACVGVGVPPPPHRLSPDLPRGPGTSKLSAHCCESDLSFTPPPPLPPPPPTTPADCLTVLALDCAGAAESDRLVRGESSASEPKGRHGGTRGASRLCRAPK